MIGLSNGERTLTIRFAFLTQCQTGTDNFGSGRAIEIRCTDC